MGRRLKADELEPEETIPCREGVASPGGQAGGRGYWRGENTLVSILCNGQRSRLPSLPPPCLCSRGTCPLTCLSLHFLSSLHILQSAPGGQPDYARPSFQTASDLSLTSEPSRDPVVPVFSCNAFWEAYPCISSDLLCIIGQRHQQKLPGDWLWQGEKLLPNRTSGDM